MTGITTDLSSYLTIYSDSITYQSISSMCSYLTTIATDADYQEKGSYLTTNAAADTYVSKSGTNILTGTMNWVQQVLYKSDLLIILY